MLLTDLDSKFIGKHDYVKRLGGMIGPASVAILRHDYRTSRADVWRHFVSTGTDLSHVPKYTY